MRLSGTKTGAVNQYRGLGNQLWDLAGNRPSLDLPFSDTKSLVDTTTGKTLVDHTRASSGTYVGSDGLIKTATTNLVLWSEEFDNAAWTKFRIAAFGSGSIANAIPAPNGTTTADLLVQASGQTNAGVVTVSVSGIAAPVAYSVYAKAGTKSRLSILTDISGNGETWFNLSTGLPGTTGSNHTASIQNVGNGWYRCIVRTSLANYFSIYLADTDGSRVVADSGGIYLWGAQLEQSSTVGEYIPTTSTINSAPRFDHDPTTGESLGLLVEESRTNLLVRSEEFDNASWTKGANTTVTANYAAAPNGTITAERVEMPNNTGTVVSQSATVVSGLVYTFSVYARATATTSAFVIQLGTDTASYTLTAQWQRYSISFTATTTSLTAALDNGSSAVDFLIWGAQLEAGSFPTSYIPTTTATVTRAADVASISGSNFSSWYRQDEGSVYLSNINQRPYSGTNNFSYALQFDATNNNDRIHIDNGVLSSGQRYLMGVIASGNTEASFNLKTGINAGTKNQVAIAYAVSDAAGSVNGETVAKSTPGALPAGVNRLQIGNGTGGQLTGTIRRLTFWQTRLPNETLQGITQ